jgi:hypothetical protein
LKQVIPHPQIYINDYVGSVKGLKWLRENGCELSSYASVKAAKCGHLETLKWLIKHVKWYSSYVTCADVAEGGHLETLKWLHKRGCTLDQSTCAMAARGGHLETLKWLRSRGCPWNEWVGHYATTRVNINSGIFQWLEKNDYPWIEKSRERIKNRIVNE